MKAIPLILAVTCSAIGCTSEPVKEPPKAAVETPRVVRSYPAVTPAPTPAPVTQAAAKPRVDGDSINDPNSLLSKRTIYYDYDSTDIKDEYKPMIRAHAGYLATNRSAKVRIEGNCDERGSREYNLALGQRRAESVKAAMKLLGTADGQIETVSWGEEKPKAPGHDEAAWSPKPA
jgi:peptidoglycan-associated lipoprotein